MWGDMVARRFEGALPSGQQLLELPQYNKGTAFSREERIRHGLLGLLPPHEETLEQQTERAYQAYQAKTTDLEKHIYLRQLQDFNETLFYRLIMAYPAEMTPIIYTPTVGEACQKFSEIYRKPRGLFIAYPEREHVGEILDHAIPDDVRIIVVTDGEAILGLGDLGAGGMAIPIGKLALYTANGGIDPNVCLPIVLDAGTNNPELLNDPLYIGWAHERIEGIEYMEFVDQVMEAIAEKFPDALVQFEDFGRANAGPMLARYRDKYCCFNDDIQGTAAVAMGTVLAGARAAHIDFADMNFVIAGGGSAGCGIAEQLVLGLRAFGLTEAEARARLFLVDKDGLLREDLDDLTNAQLAFVKSPNQYSDWDLSTDNPFGLYDVVRNVKPQALLGVSGQTGLFSEDIVREMAAHNERPIIFPLSNPTIRAEARPADVFAWSEGRALVATGSPFDPVYLDGVTYNISQCNNAFVFPGMGLGILAAGASRVTDEMFMVAAQAIGQAVPDAQSPGAPLLPPLSAIRELSKQIAVAVAACALEQGIARATPDDNMNDVIEALIWQPEYRDLKQPRSK